MEHCCCWLFGYAVYVHFNGLCSQEHTDIIMAKLKYLHGGDLLLLYFPIYIEKVNSFFFLLIDENDDYKYLLSICVTAYYFFFRPTPTLNNMRINTFIHIYFVIATTLLPEINCLTILIHFIS